jgi:hypothetical protein
VTRRHRRKGMRLNDYVVGRLPFKDRQYTVGDLTASGCGVRVSATTKACVITVWTGGRLRFETVGRISADAPYEYLRELAIKRMGELKRSRLPRAPLRQIDGDVSTTLRQAFAAYLAAHPRLRKRTAEKYSQCLKRNFAAQLDQPVALLVAQEILRLNTEHLERLVKIDAVNTPPNGFYGWQSSLRSLRTILGWYAATQSRPNPWPNHRALRIVRAPPRRLPVELQTVEGRRRLVEGLKSQDTWTARATLFICYTGLRRREGTALTQSHLIGRGVLEFESKTRDLRIPLARQAHALIDLGSTGGLLRVAHHAIHKPLIQIFGYRQTPRGRRACVTPHDLRRYFKTVGTELGIDPTIMNLLVGHSVKGVDAHYIAQIRLSVLRAAAQRIADEIDNPHDPVGESDESWLTPDAASAEKKKWATVTSYLCNDPADQALAKKPARHAHYFTRETLYELIWSVPLTELADRLGISDVGLAKACRRATIPLPGRGYWAKVEAGQMIVQTPLLSPPAGIPGLIRIAGTRTAPSQVTVQPAPFRRLLPEWASEASRPHC